MIEASDLHKHFGRIKAVDGISLEVPDGQITGLLGPNGSGKTTSLRLLCGLLPPDRGQVRIDGLDLAGEPLAARARLGVVPDARGLYPRLSARENIAYFGQLQGLAAATLDERIVTLSAQLDMDDFLDRRAQGFSQGQRAKVAIARALVGDPQNLLLDEPGNGLDVMSNRALRQFLLALRQQGKAILLSTHIMQEVSALCDQVLVIAGGKLRAQGSPQQLLARTGCATLEQAFVQLIGSDEGIMA